MFSRIYFEKYTYDFSNNQIELPYYIQTLNLEFVGLSFNKSEKNNYRYTKYRKMLGLAYTILRRGTRLTKYYADV